MKKLTLVAAVATAVVALSSCGNSTPKAELDNRVDSMSYAIGMSQTQGLKDYLVNRVGVDTAYIDEFVKGLIDGAQAGDDKKKAAYYAGIQIGQQIGTQMVKGIEREVFGADSTQHISMKNLLAGFISGTTGKGGKMTMDQAAQTAQRLVEQIKAETNMKQYGANKTACEKFMAAKKAEAGVVALPSGVLYKIIKKGEGKVAADTSMVKLNYEGKTIDGKTFDKSKEPVSLRANQLIPGFTDALTNMPAGSTWEVYIPQERAYGAHEAGPQIKPYSALVFTIEVLEVK